LHPLNYTLGLATAAERAGTVIFEQSAAVAIDNGARVRVRTEAGNVDARFVVLCCNTYIGTLQRQLDRRIMPVTTYLAATEPLGAALASQLIAHDIAVSDTNFILDYFRRSADDRLLFGGRVSYSGKDWGDTARMLRRRMLNVFPQLANVNMEYAWSGKIDITVNRAPDFGRLGPQIYYLQGFSGHGIALTGMAGKLVSEAIAGQAERFDVFAQIKHRHFVGGELLRTPALVLAMLWYRMRDLL
jgi:gamma-glutamylputrescine oxidase